MRIFFDVYLHRKNRQMKTKELKSLTPEIDYEQPAVGLPPATSEVYSYG
jgi:hypothetical protein